MSVKNFPFILLVTAFAFAACAPQSTPEQAVEQPADTSPVPELTATSIAIPEISGAFEVNGHSLYIRCLGTGSPTIVLEAGEGGSDQGFDSTQRRLAKLTTTCAYDRANNGRSERGVSKPRTAQDVVEDLHGLLSAAEVSGPFLLVGHGAGGMFVQLYARTYPGEVVGVVAMNPVPPADPWLEEVSKVFTADEYAIEEAYYQGDNRESIDYIASSEQIALAPPPPNIPFEMLFSTNDACDFNEMCAKASSIMPRVIQDLTFTWPRGNFVKVPVGHLIFLEDPDAVISAVERILASI